MKKLGLLVVLLFTLLATSACGRPSELSSSSDEQVTTVDLDTVVMDENGQELNLAAFKGKKVYLNVWASWCGPCQQEMPELEEIYQAYKDKDDYAFLSLTSPNDKVFGNSNPADGSKKEILKTARKAGVTYPILFDTKDKAMSSLNISAFPTHYLINSDGTVDKVYLGRISKADLKTFLEELE